jgi:23S rRNA (uracil1939-C5)-methyltransferase
MSKKNKFEELKIEKLIFPNKGIAYYKDEKVIIKNTLVGQKVYVQISKRKGVYKGRLIEILEKSPIEILPLCEDFGLCGGCTYQNIAYETELKIKEDMVLKLLKDEKIDDFTYQGIEKAPNHQYYRNKMEYSFGDQEKGGELALGMRKRNSYYEVVTSKRCNIVDADYRSLVTEVLNFFRNTEEKFYHKATHLGSLRHLVIRKGFFTGEIIINIITNDSLKTNLQPLVENLNNLKLTGKIVGIYNTINNSLADVVKCDEFKLLYGQGFYMDKLLGLDFKISPFSFFQTNSEGAEKLYSTVKDYIGDSKDLNIFDLYCGTGTIAQILAQNAKEVIGVEIVEEAITSANANAKLNNITNCKFIAGDVLKVVDELEVKPDIIILDPPRDGIHPKAIQKIIAFDAKKIIYVSCKPSSLARDLTVFIESGYKIEKIKCHDMFSRTYHVETVVLLSR